MLTSDELSPTDLIRDFIPVVGYLDDLIIVPIGLTVVIRLLRPHVLESSQTKLHRDCIGATTGGQSLDHLLFFAMR